MPSHDIWYTELKGVGEHCPLTEMSSFPIAFHEPSWGLWKVSSPDVSGSNN